VQPDVCGSETIIRPFSYEAVIEDAPHEHSCCAPAAPAQDATINSAAAATVSFARVCAKTPNVPLSLNALEEAEVAVDRTARRVRAKSRGISASPVLRSRAVNSGNKFNRTGRPGSRCLSRRGSVTGPPVTYSGTRIAIRHAAVP